MIDFKKIVRDLIKRFFGVEGTTIFIKKYKKKINKNIYRKKYTADELINVMCEMGMIKGSIIFLHSSMLEFYNYNGTAEELIDKIIGVIGDEGTLLMPAFPKDKTKLLDKTETVLFDVKNAPSGAGYLTEVFRKYPGVKRSINLQHSVSAYGKLAEELTKDHHMSSTAWDEFSPYYKICQYDNTIVFSLGLPEMIGTIIHCVESLLKDKYLYFNTFFQKKIEYNYIDSEDNLKSHTFYTQNFQRKTNKKIVVEKYFDKSKIRSVKLSNLSVKAVDAKYTLNKLMELADNGITIFTSPNPAPYIKDGKFIKLEEK